MGLKFGRGRQRNVAHESAAVVGYRARFLRHLRSNRDADNRPIAPEVYLDESYVNKNHSRQETWYDPDSFVGGTSGAGPRYCMFGAGAYFQDEDGNLVAQWVPDSFQFWPAARKPGSGKTRSEAIDKGEYHGNIDHEMFISWFRKLCQTLQETLGNCVIIMDGASYHKKAVDKAPTRSATKTVMQAWLDGHGIVWEAGSTKAELYHLVQQHKEEVVVYHSIQVAEEFGHTVSFLPPYHPELNPIEMIWAQLKNPIAATARRTMKELGEALAFNATEKITEKTWIGAWKRSQEWVLRYLAEAEALESSDLSSTGLPSETEDESDE